MRLGEWQTFVLTPSVERLVRLRSGLAVGPLRVCGRDAVQELSRHGHRPVPARSPHSRPAGLLGLHRLPQGCPGGHAPDSARGPRPRLPPPGVSGRARGRHGVEARRADAPLRRGPPHRVSGPAATEPPAPPPGRAVALLRTCSAAHSVWLFKVTLNLKGIKSTFSGQTRNVPLVTENSVGPMGDVGAREAGMGVCLLRPVTE